MPHFPEDRDPVMRRLRDLERKVDGLYARNPLASATLDDEDGNRRINFGRLDDDDFGIAINDDAGHTVFKVDEDGLRFALYDADGNLRFSLGPISDGMGGPTTYGFVARDANGVQSVWVDDAGIRMPLIDVPTWSRNETADSTTSTSWVSLKDARLQATTARALMWSGVISADPGTTGEARLVTADGAGDISGVRSIAAGSSTSYVWDWLLPSTPGVIESRTVSLQVRRTGGSGSLHAYHPWMAIGDSPTASADGL